MRFDIEEVFILSNLSKQTPERTPNRLSVIKEFASDIFSLIHDNSQKKRTSVVLKLHDESDIEKTNFVLSEQNLSRVAQNLPDLDDELMGIAKKCRILIPTKIFCCHKVLNILTAYAAINIYSQNGVTVVKSYHAKCRVCNIHYYHGFCLDKQKGSIIFDEDLQSDWIIFNSGVGFSRKILEFANNMISLWWIVF